MPLNTFILAYFSREGAGEEGKIPAKFLYLINVLCGNSRDNTTELLFKSGSVIFVVCELNAYHNEDHVLKLK